MEVYIARQPIFDLDMNVVAYELLYRSSEKNHFIGTNPDEATSDVIINTFQNFGVSRLTEGKKAFINFTEKLIFDEVATIFPNDILVIEILETVRPSRLLIERCKQLNSLGYTIVLDDFIFDEASIELMSLADVIKIDFLNTDPYTQDEMLKMYAPQGVRFLAEKVETLEEFEKAKKLGYELFQGYFFSKPEILKSTMVQPVQANYIRLLGEINSADMNFDTLENVISNDLALTYSLLKLINSSFFGLRRKVTSVKHAIALLGEQEIKKWGTLVVLKGLGEDKPEELVRLSMVRARFMELIGKYVGLDRTQSSYLFLAGLLSLLDVILNTTMNQVLEDISVSGLIKDILIYERGPLAPFYELAILYEKGKFDEVDELLEQIDIHKSDLTSAYLDTIEWSKQLK